MIAKLTTNENTHATGDADHLLAQECEAAAVEQPVGACGVDCGAREDAGHQRAERAAHAVDAHDVERVIELETILELDAEVARDARRESDDHRWAPHRHSRSQA